MTSRNMKDFGLKHAFNCTLLPKLAEVWVMTITMTLVLFLVATPTVFARGGGGGHGGGGHGAGTGLSGTGQHQGQAGTRKYQGECMRATEQQGNQYHNCLQSTERVCERNREMSQAAKGSGFGREQARQQLDQLRGEVRTMEEEHERFMHGLSDAQRARVGERIQKIDRARDRVRAHVEAMDQGLDQADFDGKSAAEQAREMEKTVKEWQEEHRKIGSDLGMD